MILRSIGLLLMFATAVPSAYARSWDSCRGIFPSTGERIYLQSTFTDGSPMEVTGTIVDANNTPPGRSFFIPVERTETEVARVYQGSRGDRSIVLTINWADCKGVTAGRETTCSGTAELEGLGESLPIALDCKINLPYTAPKPPSCHPGRSCH